MNIPCKDKVHEAKAEGCDKSFPLSGAGIAEDGGRIEGDDIDTTPEEMLAYPNMHSGHGTFYICCAIITTNEASVALLTRGMVKSCANRDR